LGALFVFEKATRIVICLLFFFSRRDLKVPYFNQMVYCSRKTTRFLKPFFLKQAVFLGRKPEHFLWAGPKYVNVVGLVSGLIVHIKEALNFQKSLVSGKVYF